MKRLLRLCLIISSVLLLLGFLTRAFFGVVYFETKDATPPKPTSTPQFAAESWVNLPVSIPLDEAQRVMNASVPRNLHERRGENFTSMLAEDWIEYNVNRGDITLLPAAGRLAFGVPVSGSLSAGGHFRPIPIGRGISIQQTCNFSGTLYGSTGIRLNPDWSLTPDLQLDLALQEAEIRLLNSISISVRSKVKELFHRVVPQIQQQVAQQALSQFRIREQAERAWAQLHVTVQMAKSPESYVSVTPSAIAARAIRVGDDRTITGGFGLRCTLNGRIGSAPAVPALSPLPALLVVENLPNDFHLELPIRIDPVSVSKTLNEQLARAPITIGKYRVNVSKPAVSVVGNKLILSADIEAARGFFAKRVRGRVSLEATPSIDESYQTIELSDLRFTLATRDAITRVAHWLLEPAIIGEFRKRSRYSFATDLQKAKAEIVRAVPRLTADSKGSLSAAFNKLDVKGLKLEGGEIFLIAAADGTATLILKP